MSTYQRKPTYHIFAHLEGEEGMQIQWGEDEAEIHSTCNRWNATPADQCEGTDRPPLWDKFVVVTHDAEYDYDKYINWVGRRVSGSRFKSDSYVRGVWKIARWDRRMGFYLQDTETGVVDEDNPVNVIAVGYERTFSFISLTPGAEYFLALAIQLGRMPTEKECEQAHVSWTYLDRILFKLKAFGLWEGDQPTKKGLAFNALTYGQKQIAGDVA